MAKLAVRHQHLLALKQVLETKVVFKKRLTDIQAIDQPRDSTILTQILSADTDLLSKLGENPIDSVSEFILSKFMCLNASEYHKDNLSSSLLRFLDQSDQDSHLKAFSEYLKLMPDNFELDVSNEWLV